MIFLGHLCDVLWCPFLLGLFLAVGLYYSARTGFFQLFRLPAWLRSTLWNKRSGSGRHSGALTERQALSTALASTIGTGSIAGVATALFFGGPGAVFWMWISAFVGMMTGFAEKTLAICYRRKDRRGHWQGGPMFYLQQGVGSQILAVLFALSCIAASLTGGNMVQSNSIAAALESAFGWRRALVGVAVALAAGAVILGGLDRIGNVSERLVPAMALIFTSGAAVVLIANREKLPAAFAEIVSSALSPRAAAGGGGGYTLAAGLRYGTARGVFTNEAGMGSSVMAHAAADTACPAEQGMWGILEVFLATFVVSTMTALVLLTSGVYDPQTACTAIRCGQIQPSMLGAPLSAAAFSTVFGHFGKTFVAICLLLFAFTSLLGWNYYGEQALTFLWRSGRAHRVYQFCFLAAIILGSMGEVSVLWQLADLFNGLMALPNLIALLLLSPQVLMEFRRWVEKRPKS